MSEPGILLCFYANREDADEAIRQLRRKRFRRAALIGSSADGKLSIDQITARHGALWGVIAGLLIGPAVGLVWMDLEHLFLHLMGLLVLVLPGLVGLIGGWLFVRLLNPGVYDSILQKYARWLVAEETVLIVQATAESMGQAIALIRTMGDTQPTVFALHPERVAHDAGWAAAPSHGEPLTPPRLREHARRLADTHQVGPDIRPSEEPLLRLLNDCEKTIESVRRELAEASRLEQSISPSAEWILDNAYIVQGQIADVRKNLPRRFYHELPVLSADPHQGHPRIYSLASELIVQTDARLDRTNITEFLESYQAGAPLTMGELWAVPLMLRIALIDALRGLAEEVDRRLRQREFADFWAHRLLAAARRDPNQLLFILAELAREQSAPGGYFAFQLTGHLYDEEAALVPVQSWLERKLGAPLAEIISDEQSRQAADQVSIANAITSLRRLTLLDWRDIFESQSRVEAILRDDPPRVYARMDFATRDLYRHAVEQIARGSGADEREVAGAAIELCRHDAGQADPPGDPRPRHVGYWLIDEGRPTLVARMSGRESSRRRALQWVDRHHTAIYLGAVAVLSAAALLAALLLEAAQRAYWWNLALLAAAGLLPATEVSVQFVNYLITRLLPPRPLPKMDFQARGLPDEFRSLVVVPMMLLTPDNIRAEAEKLEIRYLANPDPNLLYGLLSDFADADEPTTPRDEPLLKLARERMEDLNSRYATNRFFLFHRPREWAESERRYIGWERKRGKLEELNGLLNGEPGRRKRDDLIHVGEPSLLTDVRFVITLDSDTQLPRDTARRMVETLAHPLNQPRLSEDRARVVGGYTIIQPRVSTSLPSATATRFSRLFTDPIGTDPYTKAVSDVYQDLAGEGTYHGKGIYDPRVFHEMLTGRFPEQRLLSHDLIEGAHVRTALATDIELFDDFPSDYFSWTARNHRWIRGDWQIAPWALPRVPDGRIGSAANPLTPLNRWKVLDNLRRSLTPAAMLLFLTLAWLLAPRLGAVVSLLVGVLMLFPPLSQVVTWLTSRPGSVKLSPRLLLHSVARSLANVAILPHQALVSLDAIMRVFVRRLTGRLLLQWTTAQVAQWQASSRGRRRLIHQGLISLAAALLAGALVWLNPAALWAAAPFLMLWMAAPLVNWWLYAEPEPKPARAMLSASERRTVRRLARRTWRYFDDFVGPESYWLPPDNYQVSHIDHVAPRTSPTNIGLWLLSALAARDMGYLSVDQMIDRIGQTFRTLDELEKFEGHLLNWYNIETLRPLEPRYVSFVDSGNLLAALWTLEVGVKECIDGPLLGGGVLRGLSDTLGVLLEALHQSGRPEPPGQMVAVLEQLFTHVRQPGGFEQIVRRIRLAAGPAEMLARALKTDAAGGVEAGAAYWATQLERQIGAWATLIDRYFAWAELLAEEPEETLMLLGDGMVHARRDAMAHAPSLRRLAGGHVPIVGRLLEARQAMRDLPRRIEQWLDRLDKAFSQARWLASEMLALAEGALQRSHELGAGMNLRFLYDPQRRLFAIGYNVSEHRLDGSYYDLLASESRLGSFVAVARGEAPTEHWMALGRPYGSAGHRRVLLSWSGTMFEYLMPLLLQRDYDNSLLASACRAAVTMQIDFARRRGVPWGISESAYSDLDVSNNYQYQAFGVPGLGLKRGLDDDLVVAPYATVLALSLEPQAASRNLQRLARMGLGGDYGLFEAIDFSRQRRGGQQGVIVHAYMAHHQGMSLLAIDNLINEDPMRRRFHADPRVRATEPLLFERVPIAPPIYQIPTRERAPSHVSVADTARASSDFDTPHSPTPRTHLLGNGDYAVMITSAGGGYSRWGDYDITRWRADTTADPWGLFCYLRDADSGEVWSAACQPTGVLSRDYSASFHMDRAEFRVKSPDAGVEAETEIFVSPEDDAEIRRITLINRSSRPRRIELTSYVELVLARHNADRMHPAFNKMFIRTQALPRRGALLATRRPRDPGEPPIWAMHLMAVDPATAGPAAADRSRWGEAAAGPVQYETDRARFIGRGRDASRPAGLAGDLYNSSGAVLDPIFCLRRHIVIEPGGRVRLSLVLGAADNRQAVLDMIDKYSDPQAVHRTADLAWTHAQLQLRHLRIQPDEARRFQQLASYMLYPSATHRPPANRLRANRLGQSRLWAYGISGDLPIAAVTLGESRDVGLVRQILLAHTYWRRQGLKADLLILNEESSSYEKPLHDQLTRLIQAHTMYTGVDQPGGVFLRNVDQIPEEDLTLMLATARVSLVAARGPLAQQLGAPTEAADLPARFTPTGRYPEEPSAPLPFMELPYFNGLGGFTPDGREYAIYLGPGDQTPAPWCNVMANPSFGALVSESGGGTVWAGNSQSNRLIPWSNDPVCDPPGEAIYIRDEDTGHFWTPTPSPIRELDAYRARHGAGYSVFEHNSHAIEQELIAFVPMDDNGGLPVRVQRLKLRNDSSRVRRLSVTFYAEWTLGDNRENTQMHVVTAFDTRSRALLAFNRYHPDFGGRVAFVHLRPGGGSGGPDTYSGDRASFLGRNGRLSRPAAMFRRRLSERVGAGLDPCAALQTTVELAPGQSGEVVILLGQASGAEDVARIVSQFRSKVQVDDSLARTSCWWDRVLGTIEVRTPAKSVNFLLSRWLLYQTLACRIWGRTAFYQSGGAFGFRDQLQDVAALVHAGPEGQRIAREQILVSAARQFVEGDVLHWWHPPGGAGIRSRCCDDLLWLPGVVAHYVRTTGDAGILDERVPFIEGRQLKDDEHEAYLTPNESGQSDTLLEHCRRAVERGCTQGPHGLPLIGSGDWNDGFNRIGLDGRGESVWMAWFLADVLNSLAEVLEERGDREPAADYRSRGRRLIEAAEKHAWDGQWYVRAFFDDGRPLGASACEEAKIDSIAQSWAVIAGADATRSARALRSAREMLIRPDDQLAMLFTPPFDSSSPSPGYIQGYPPGVRENGGQYTHAAIWLAMAIARTGDGDGAGELLRMLNPVEHARTPADVDRYKVEPYVMTADVYTLPGRVGRGGWSWYTGSAGWMYRVWIEEALGLKRRGDRLVIDPVISSQWEGFSVRYRHGEAIYEIEVQNPDGVCRGVVEAEVDGRPLELTDGLPAIALDRQLVKHRVRIRMGGASSSARGDRPTAGAEQQGDDRSAFTSGN
ncbi:MAG: hypothetical protein BIFFINMI_04094 [Phycisphaerae bacterium]|nr:hypothetical protein [Phycisphaerae bacterium]